MGDDLKVRTQQPAQACNRLFQVIERGGIADIAHMGGCDGKPVTVHGCIRVQLRSDSKYTAAPEIDRRALRGDPAGEPDDIPVPDHRIVAPVHDGAVVRKEEVNVTGELPHRMVNAGYHRVAGHVGARHDQERVTEPGEEQVVKPGVREHAADGMEVADYGVCERVVFREHHNGVHRAVQERPFSP